MTSLSLLMWIVLAVALQLAVLLVFVLRRHRRDYQALPNRAATLNSPITQKPMNAPAPASWPGLRRFRVERKTVEDAAQSVCSFYLVPEDNKALPSFSPGQYLTFQLDIPTAQGGTEQITRCYTLSDAPHPDYYRVSIKRVPPPAGSHFAPGRSSNFFHDHVAVGGRLQALAPAGHFFLDHGMDPVVLVGGGIGITPMLSMLNWCLAKQQGREIWLFYGVRHGRERVMKSHLEALAAAYPNFRLRIYVSDPLPDDITGHDYQQRGRINIETLRMQLPLKPYHFYVCGPTPMMESLVPALEDWGVPQARIHFESFGPASIKLKAAMPQEGTAGIIVTFANSGKQLPWQPAFGSLLEFAEANGIAVKSGCRSGCCGACLTKLQAGEISYRQPPDFDPKPGDCLLCVGTPKTDITIEA